MYYIGTVVLTLSHFIEKEQSGSITPNELRAAAEEFACQMEALEKEGWHKSGKVHWANNLPTHDDKRFTLSVRYSRRFIGKGHFLQELELTERAGFNTDKATVFLTGADNGEGVVWQNREEK